MIETTDINNAAERRDIITKYGMLEQAGSSGRRARTAA